MSLLDSCSAPVPGCRTLAIRLVPYRDRTLQFSTRRNRRCSTRRLSSWSPPPCSISYRPAAAHHRRSTTRVECRSSFVSSPPFWHARFAHSLTACVLPHVRLTLFMAKYGHVSQRLQSICASPRHIMSRRFSKSCLPSEPGPSMSIPCPSSRSTTRSRSRHPPDCTSSTSRVSSCHPRPDTLPCQTILAML
jgi:hypothetical protein